MLLEMLKKYQKIFFLRVVFLSECFWGVFKVVFNDYINDDLFLSGISAL